MSDNLSNSSEVKSEMVPITSHRYPPPPPPLHQFLPAHQHVPPQHLRRQSSTQHRRLPSHRQTRSNPPQHFKSPGSRSVQKTTNSKRMSHSNYQKTGVQQSIREQVLINGYISRKLHVAPVNVPAPVQTTSKESDDTAVEKLRTSTANHFHALGQIFGVMCSSNKNQKEELRELRTINKINDAQKEAHIAKIHELDQKFASLENNMDELRKTCEKQVQEAKVEEANWKDKCVELNEQQMDLKIQSVVDKRTIKCLQKTVSDKESKIKKTVLTFTSSERQLKKELGEKDEEIELLKNKLGENEIKIKDKEARVLDLEKSERKLKEELEVDENTIQMCENRYDEEIDRYSKLNERFKSLQATSKTRTSKIQNFEKSEKAHKETIRNLESEQSNLKLNVEELKAKVKNSSEKNSQISQELEKERNDMKVKVVELEKKTKEVQDLKEKLKILKKEKKELPNTFDTLVKQLRSSVFLQKQTERAVSSSSESEEESMEPSSMAVDEDNKNEKQFLESQEAAFIDEKRKSLKIKSAENTRSVDDNSSLVHAQPKSKVIFLPQINCLTSQKPNTGRNAEIPEVSRSSRASSSPSSSGK